jgi:hypothetical protein
MAPLWITVVSVAIAFLAVLAGLLATVPGLITNLITQHREDERRRVAEEWRRASERRARLAEEFQRLLLLGNRFYGLTQEWRAMEQMSPEDKSAMTQRMRDLQTDYEVLQVRLRLEGVPDLIEPLQGIVDNHRVFRGLVEQLADPKITTGGAERFDEAIKRQSAISAWVGELEKRLPVLLDELQPAEAARPSMRSRSYWTKRAIQWWNS